MAGVRQTIALLAVAAGFFIGLHAIGAFLVGVLT